MLVDVRLRSDTDPAAFEAALTRMRWITEAIHVTGVWDYQLRVRLPDTARLDELVRTLKRETGAESTQTRLVLRTIRISASDLRSPSPRLTGGLRSRTRRRVRRHPQGDSL